MALVMPWLELLCGVALILGFFYRGAVLWMNVLLVVFIIALGSTIMRGISIDCGCFKAAEAASDSAKGTLIRDLVAMVFSVQLLFSRSRRWQISGR
jgi:putative oxidoreductase